MLLTTIPAALDRGATLYTRLRAERLQVVGSRVSALDCVALQADGIHPAGKRVHLRARHFVVAGGAIGSPALPVSYTHLDVYKRQAQRGTGRAGSTVTATLRRGRGGGTS